jgi:hypothetical protein
MPHIKLIKEYTRGEKTFPEGTMYFCSWSGYREMLDNGYCNKIKEDKQVKKLVKKETKIDTKKAIE